MRDLTAAKVFSAVVGLIAGVIIMPYLDDYVFWLIALVGAIAFGVLVYWLCLKVIASLVR